MIINPEAILRSAKKCTHKKLKGDSDVGDIVMMVTDSRCWWQNHYDGDFIRYDLLIGHQNLKPVNNTFGLQHPSPTSM